jgi:hypothetical protein
MRTINTLAELKEERKRLNARKVFLESEIKMNYEAIKEDLKPLQLITKGAGKALSSKDNSLFGDSIGHITNLVVKKIFLKNAGFLTRMIVPFLAKNVASNVAEENKPKITEWITDLIGRIKNRRSNAEEAAE